MGQSISAAAFAVAALLEMTPGPALGQPVEAATGDAVPRVERVRCLDRSACRMLTGAVAASPTVAQLIERLQYTDLIVGIESGPLEPALRGQVRFLAAAGGVRHVRIRVRAQLAPIVTASTLGHELHHAMEIAALSEVRDAASFARAFTRIGSATRMGGYFETEAAVTIGRRVAEEAETARRRARAR